MKPNPAAPTVTVSFGVTSPAPAFAVEDGLADPEGLVLAELEDDPAICVTTVVVCGGTVVPGIVVAETVDTGFAATPLGRL